MMGAVWTERLCHTRVSVGVDQGRLLIGRGFSDAVGLNIQVVPRMVSNSFEDV